MLELGIFTTWFRFRNQNTNLKFGGKIWIWTLGWPISFPFRFNNNRRQNRQNNRFNNNRPVNNRPVNNNRPANNRRPQTSTNQNPLINNGRFRATPANARDKLGNEVYPGCNGTVCLPEANLCARRKNKRKFYYYSFYEKEICKSNSLREIFELQIGSSVIDR